MADRYWVGGSGNWSNANNWSDTSGGLPGASVPTAVDNVIFDANSSRLVLFTVTVDGTSANPSVCNNFSTGGAGGALSATTMTLSLGATAVLDCYGSMTLPATNFSFSTTSGAAIIYRATTTGKTITTNGVSFGIMALNFNGVGGSWTLGSALTTTGQLTVLAGSFNTSVSNYSVSCAAFVTQGTLTRSIDLNGSTITATATGGLNFVSITNLTFNAGTSTINCTNASPTFAGGGLTFYNVSFPTGSTATTVTITGDNTFNNLSITIGTTIKVIALGGNQTVNGTLTMIPFGTAISRFFMRSSVIGTQRTMTVAALGNTLTDIDFRDINVQGASAPWSGVRLGDCFGNANITFESANTRYWSLAAGGSWNSTGWANTSGGTPLANNFPLAQDTALIKDTGLNSGATITINSLWNIGKWDMSTRTLPMNLTFGNSDPVVYKDFLLSNVVNFTTRTGTPTLTLSSQNSTQNLQSGGGNTIIYQIVADCPNTTVKLVDDYRIEFPTLGAGLFILTRGTLDLNDRTLSCNAFSSSNSNQREIRFTGNGKIDLFASNTTIWNSGTGATLLYANGTSNVICSYDGSVGRRTITPGTPGAANTINFNVIAGSDEVILTSSDYCKTLDFTGFSGTWINSSSSRIYGNLIMSNTMTTQAGAATLNLFGVSYDQFINTNGVVIKWPVTIYDEISFNTGLPNASQFTLQNDFTLDSPYQFGLSTGNFVANNYNVSAGSFVAGSSTNLSYSNLVMGSGTWNMTGSGTVWSVGGVNRVISSNNSTINVSNTISNVSFAGDDYTYNNIIFSSANTNGFSISGNLTANNITFAPQTLDTIGRKSISVGNNTITITGTLSLSGNNSNQRSFVLSDGVTTTRIVANNIAPLQYVDFRHIQAAGNSVPWSGISLGDSGYNSNITFNAGRTIYWNKPTGGNWSDVAWSTTDGGTVDVNNFPLAQDSIVFTNTGLNSGATINTDNDYQIGNIDFSLLTNSATIDLLNSGNDLYGNVILSPNLNIVSTQPSDLYFNTKNSNTSVTSANVAFPANTYISFQLLGDSNSIRLNDNFTSNSAIFHRNGNLNLNNYILSCNTFGSSYIENRSIRFGNTGIIKITGSNTTVVGMQTMTNFTYEGSGNVFLSNTNSVGTRTVNMGNSGGGTEENSLNLIVAPASDQVSVTGVSKDVIYQDGFTGSGGMGNIIFGNLYLANNMISTATTGLTSLRANTGIKTLTTNGVIINRPLAFNGQGTFKLVDDLTINKSLNNANYIFLQQGKLDLASKNLSCGIFQSYGVDSKTLSMNAGTLIINSNAIPIASSPSIFQLGVPPNSLTSTSFINRDFIFEGSPANSKIILAAANTAAPLVNYDVNFGGYYLNTNMEIATSQPLEFQLASVLNNNGGVYRLYNTVNPVTISLNDSIFVDRLEIDGTTSNLTTINATSISANAGYGFISRTGQKTYFSNTRFANVTFYPANTWYAYTTDGNINDGNVNNITFEDSSYTTVARLANTGEFFIPEPTQLDEVNPQVGGKYVMTKTGQIDFNEFDETGGISVAGRLHSNGTIQILGEFNEIDGIK